MTDTTRDSLRFPTVLAAALVMAAGCAAPAPEGAKAGDSASGAAGGTAQGTPAAAAPAASSAQGGSRRAAWRVPAESEIRDSAVRNSVRRGRALMLATKDSLPRHVGNKLRCVSCHTGDGVQPNAMPFVGVYSRFPQYRSRSGTVQVIEDRINDCFERSMNGKALDPNSRDMKDVVAYMAFLSYGIPVGHEVEGQGLPRIEPLVGDTVRGAQLYATSCTTCHGPGGEGTAVGPPVWGPQSYNIGAGMARVRTAASFIKLAMPMDRPNTLTDQQAFDLAAYINSRPRPDFSKKMDDWPYGDPPPDAAYQVKSVSKGN